MSEPLSQTDGGTGAANSSSPFQGLRENWVWYAVAIATVVLLYFLGPNMTPFVVGAALSYLGNPVCDRLERHGVPRALAVLLCFWWCSAY